MASNTTNNFSGDFSCVTNGGQYFTSGVRNCCDGGEKAQSEIKELRRQLEGLSMQMQSVERVLVTQALEDRLDVKDSKNGAHLCTDVIIGKARTIPRATTRETMRPLFWPLTSVARCECP